MEKLILPMKELYQEYLVDESKYTGNAQSISFPEKEEELTRILIELGGEKVPVTIQGGKTGITGGAVPEGGHILNLSHMNKVLKSSLLDDGAGRITVEPGISLMDLKKEVDSLFRKTPLFWPPDPTETSAAVGGVAAAGAQGISRMLYGDSSRYIESLHLADGDGKVTEVKWGQKITLPSGRVLERMDAVLGREGITGIITELTLILIPRPETLWGIAFFFKQEEDAGRFADRLKKELPVCKGADVAAAEYIDRASIRLIEQHKATMTKIRELPDVSNEMEGMVYVELHGQEEAIEYLAESMMETALECGSDPEEAWAVSGESEVEKLRAFRHAAAETANLQIEAARRSDSRITKLGTDMALMDLPLSQALAYYREELLKAGLKSVIFGHALQNHLHVNILPDHYEEYVKGQELMRIWAKDVAAGNGSITVEHGYGKLKKRILKGLVNESYAELCRELKEVCDKEYLLNPGNIL